MKLRSLIVIAMVIAIALSTFVPMASAAPDKPTLNWGSEINASSCPDGKLVINITEKIANDVDSGVAGNNWAEDNYNKQIQVRQISEGVFCASVKYIGSFVTFAGASPGNTGLVSEGIKGTFKGGYVATITGTLNTDPLWPVDTKGNIGTIDYGCDQAGNCPGRVSWTSVYFNAGYGFTYNWWGWIYHAGKNGSWVNSSDGNSGDITS